jgi:hypothetical protein
MKMCSRCIYDETTNGIFFDKNDVCNYCKQVELLQDEYGTGEEKGISKLNKIYTKIKKDGKYKKYDCVIGVSGGTDSSYILLKAKESGLNPIAVHYDNTWNSSVATQNISKITESLGVDLHTHVVNNIEIDDIKKAFLLSGVAEFDTDTDLAFVQVLRMAAAKYGVKYILEGHSFIEEGISPIGSNYFDGAYIADIHNKYGTKKRKTYPNMSFWTFLKWIIIYRQKFIRPLWYLDYDKEKAKIELNQKTGWNDYNGHHLENRGSAFAHSIWIPQRYGIDYRILVLAARARSAKISREKALFEFKKGPTIDKDLIEYVKKRLSLTNNEYNLIMNAKRRSWKEFKTYKVRFEKFKLLFYICSKFNLIPKSFYLKYCFPIKELQ